MLAELFRPSLATPANGSATQLPAPETVAAKVAATETMETITPEIAAEWLTRNHGNQPIRSQRVDAYCRDIVAGRWVPGHARIVIGANGVVCNGQHTLSAIVKAGTAIVCSVLRDPSLEGPRDWKGDSGGRRSGAFQAGTTGSIWSVARMIANFLSGANPTDDEASAYIDALTEVFGRITGTHVRGLSSSPIRLAVATQMKLNPQEADDIAARYLAFVNGTVDGMTQSAMRVRDGLQSGSLGTENRQRRVDLLIRAMAVFDPRRDANLSYVLIKKPIQREDETRKLLAQAWANG